MVCLGIKPPTLRHEIFQLAGFHFIGLFCLSTCFDMASYIYLVKESLQKAST